MALPYALTDMKQNKISFLLLLFCVSINLCYICNMKKELGKWLMDIAKYIVTALLLSSVFGDMHNPWIIASVILSAAITLVSGLILINDKNKEE